MTDRLKARQAKIQAKRKQTPWREFVMEIASWYSFSLYRNSGLISRYPAERIQEVTTRDEHDVVRNQEIAIEVSDDFFENYRRLSDQITPPNLMIDGINENSDFNDSVAGVNNAYLSFACVYNVSDICYSIHIKDNCDSVLNSMMVWDGSSNVYQSFGVIKSQQVFFSRFVINSHGIWYSANMQGCHDCIGCSGLENQSYCIQNKQYTKEEYEKKAGPIIRKLLHNADENYTKVVTVEGKIFSSLDVENGSFVISSDNVTNAYNCYQVKDGRNLFLVGGVQGDESIYDAAIVGSPFSKHVYASINAGNGEHIYNSATIHGGMHLYYCDYCVYCSYCLGCIGLKNKSYCIFNKQYTKEERYNKVDEIFTQMEQDDTLGQFFPGSMNPFYFNDTAAYLIDDSFTKEEVTAKGYLRRDEPIQVDIPEGATVVKTTELDQYEGFVISTEVERSTNTKPRFLDAASLHSKGHDKEVVWYIDPEILNVIIQDEEGNVYRIVQMEYDFLLKHELPLPRKHWLDRMKENFRTQ